MARRTHIAAAFLFSAWAAAGCSPLREYGAGELTCRREIKFEDKNSREWRQIRSAEWIQEGAGFWQVSSLRNYITQGKMAMTVKSSEDISPLYADHVRFIIDMEFTDNQQVVVSFANPWLHKSGILWAAKETPPNMDEELGAWRALCERYFEDYRLYIESAKPNKNFDAKVREAPNTEWVVNSI